MLNSFFLLRGLEFESSNSQLQLEFEALLAARSKAARMMSQWLDRVGTAMRLARQSGSISCLMMFHDVL